MAIRTLRRSSFLELRSRHLLRYEPAPVWGPSEEESPFPETHQSAGCPSVTSQSAHDRWAMSLRIQQHAITCPLVLLSLQYRCTVFISLLLLSVVKVDHIIQNVFSCNAPGSADGRGSCDVTHYASSIDFSGHVSPAGIPTAPVIQ